MPSGRSRSRSRSPTCRCRGARDLETVTDQTVTLALIALASLIVTQVGNLLVSIIANRKARDAVAKIERTHAELAIMHTAVNSNTKSAEAREAALRALVMERDRQITDLQVQRAATAQPPPSRVE